MGEPRHRTWPKWPPPGGSGWKRRQRGARSEGYGRAPQFRLSGGMPCYFGCLASGIGRGYARNVDTEGDDCRARGRGSVPRPRRLRRPRLARSAAIRQGRRHRQVGRGRRHPARKRRPAQAARRRSFSIRCCAKANRALQSPPCITSTTRTACSTPRTSRLARLAAEVGTPFYCYSTATLRAPLPRADRGLRRPGRAHLLRRQGQLQPGGAAHAGAARRRHGRRLRGRAAPRARGRRARRARSSSPASARRARRWPTRWSEGILGFNVESEPELHALSEVAAGLGRTARIAIRVNPDVDAKTHAKISTGKAENKFGIPYRRGAARSMPKRARCRASTSPASTCTSAARSPIWSRSATPSG